MHEDDGPLVQTFRVRRADEVLAENVERFGAQDP